MYYKVLDTNILLLDATNLYTLGSDGSTIVLPETVLDEIDTKKSSLGELGYQAREFGRLFTKATKLGSTSTDSYFSSRRKLFGTNILTVSPHTYPKFDRSEERSIHNDRKILYTAKLFSESHDNVRFITNDVMCGVRAESIGLDYEDLREVESSVFEFSRTLQIPEDTFKSLHNLPVLEADPSWTSGIYNYKFSCATTGQVKLAVVTQNKLINVIGKDTEKELRRQEVSPKNAEQLFLSHAIQNPLNNLIVAEAPAGTGSYMSLAI